MRLTLFLALLATSCLSITTTFAADVAAPDECVGPCLIYAGSIDLMAEWQHPSDSTIANSYLLLPTSESNFRFKANGSFSIMANVISEQVIDPVPGENHLLTGLGTYVDVLQAQYDFENLSIWGGKIHPAFGRAWDVTPGLHCTDLAEAYDLAERIGGGASFSFVAGGLSNKLQASAFTVDRTLLSESLFNNRGRTSLADGGAGNTSAASSFAVSLDGCIGAETDSCYDEGEFGYQLAARYQKGGAGADGNELGFLGSVNKSFVMSDETTLRLLAEAAWFRNFDGSADNALMLTGSAALETGAMTYSVAYSQQRNLVAVGANTTEHLFDATAMYDLGESVSVAGEHWSLGAGYIFASADGENTQTVGLKLSTDFATNIPFGN